MRPNYNYHTHTYRCGHAVFVNDSKYIEKYKKNNFVSIGISDHMPNTKYQLPDEKNRMDITHLNKYFRSIKKLKKKNKDINIMIGLECEYSKILGRHLCNLKNKCDYLILGQHYVEDITPISNIDYPLKYAERVCEAIETGLFSYIAHPDYFLKFRDTIQEKDLSKYINNSKKAIELICKKAKSLDIPIEINLNYVNNVRIMKDNNYPYPHKLLFEAAKKYNSKCVIGIDAHNPSAIDKYDKSFNKIINEHKDLNILYEYKPITLDKKYNRFKKSIRGFKYYYLLEILKKLPYNSNNDEIINHFSKCRINLKNSKDKIKKKLLTDIHSINKSIIDINDKKKMIERKKEFIKLTDKRYKCQDKLLIDMIKRINKLNKKYSEKKLINKLKEYYSKLR